METLKFKTNIKCSGCIAQVSPFLDAEKAIEKWEVNILTPEKTLSVQAEEKASPKIINAVKKAGFEIEELH